MNTFPTRRPATHHETPESDVAALLMARRLEAEGYAPNPVVIATPEPIFNPRDREAI